MTCQQIQQDDIAERYLTDGLPLSDRERFEEHYFACDACFARLNALRIARHELLARPATGRNPRRNFFVIAAALAACIALAVGLAVGLRSRHRALPVSARRIATPKTDALLALSRFDPPPYSPAELRSVASASQMRFESAMQSYRSGNYVDTARRLRALLAAEPNDVRARFYLGACELLLGDPRAASADLSRAIDLGDSPVLEEARIALAKAELRLDDPQDARKQLQLAAEMHGDFESEARTLLHALDQARP